MKIGIHIGRFDWPGGPPSIGPRLGEIGRAADEAGFDSLWLMDHLFQLGEEYGAIHGPADAGMLEGYAALGFLAGQTQRISLGLLVGCPVFRHPGMLVKTVSTLDVLSGGRMVLGLGAGWFEREACGFGLPFPPLSERYERLEETVRIARHVWSGETTPFRGPHTELREPIDRPLPLTRPHPPIVIGGAGERRTLKLVAQYADIWNVVMPATRPLSDFGVQHAPERDSFAMLDRKLAVLREHCQDAGRPFVEIEKSVVTYIKLGPGAMSADEVVDLCAQLRNRGFDHVIVNVIDVHTLEPFTTLAQEIIPAVHRL